MENHNAQLLNLFRQYTAKSIGRLIIEVLVKWGRERIKPGIGTDEREPAYRFWYKLQELSSNFDFDSCSQAFTEGTVLLSSEEATQKSDMILDLLHKC